MNICLYEQIFTCNKNFCTCIYRNQGIETKVLDRFQFNDDIIKWADVLFTAGGDGTYLLASSKVKDQNKPLIGVNTDPNR